MNAQDREIKRLRIALDREVRARARAEGLLKASRLARELADIELRRLSS